ncbi:L,D-transpeptidase [Pseudaminobacter sp. 19-2017]|uniref:L,D-transpeptidase n=1 Tax=Pseudaminobacter soli (ex Zhang et al. 2022) TaxID=2831468 RepID=A0A942E294_9HYPH|nr:L,D-transpeptidase [Pseudaminobacter soli]MBS3649838.1 L,D-transpeptidase [Pseudaminobacter soli]
MKRCSIARRTFLLGLVATSVSGCGYPLALGSPRVSYTVRRTVDPRYRRTRVAYKTDESPGTIVVNTEERYLYAVEPDGWATRYGVGVGEQGLTLKGVAKIGNKAEWPSWRPTESMMRRKPRLVQYADGVPGGPENPLGARALYLYQGGRDTMFRLHGTNEPWTIGTAVSSGCVRLTNEDIIDLYDRTPVGTKVVLI